MDKKNIEKKKKCWQILFLFSVMQIGEEDPEDLQTLQAFVCYEQTGIVPRAEFTAPLERFVVGRVPSGQFAMVDSYSMFTFLSRMGESHSEPLSDFIMRVLYQGNRCSSIQIPRAMRPQVNQELLRLLHRWMIPCVFSESEDPWFETFQPGHNELIQDDQLTPKKAFKLY